MMDPWGRVNQTGKRTACQLFPTETDTQGPPSIALDRETCRLAGDSGVGPPCLSPGLSFPSVKSHEA